MYRCARGHHRTGVEIVDALLEEADGDHLPVHVQQALDADTVDAARRIARHCSCVRDDTHC